MGTLNGTEVDLNLLLALDALLAERHVTRAARRLGVTQSAASHALARLRTLFGDPLLVKTGRSMTPTPRAEELVAPLRRVLGDVSALLAEGTGFDPASSQRMFQLSCPDLMASLLPRILARVASEAPGVGLEVVAPHADLAGELAAGRAELALAPSPREGDELMQRALGTLDWCVASRADHPVAAIPLTLRDWLRFPHVIVHTGNRSESMVERGLREAGGVRRVGLVVPTFLSAAHVVAQTDLLFTGPRALLAPLAGPLGLRLAPPPIPLPSVPVAAVWHTRMHADPGHAWFRALLADEVAELLRAPPPQATVKTTTAL